jgi:hypothetical protein
MPSDADLSINAVQVQHPGELIGFACGLKLREPQPANIETVDSEGIVAALETERPTSHGDAPKQRKLDLG